MESIKYSFQAVGPVFLTIAIGVLMRQRKILDSKTSDSLSRLVFHLFLPALLIGSLSQADFSGLVTFRLAAVVWGILLLSFFLARLIAVKAASSAQFRGFFASGATWSNVAIVGYALGEALYGEDGLVRAVIFSALVLPVHTLSGYIAMDAQNKKQIVKRLAANPVVLAILAGLLLNPVPVPAMISDVLTVLGQASLPLALVAIGGSLQFHSADWGEALSAAAFKLLAMPVLAFLIMRLTGMEPAWTASVVIGFSCPTAVSFFVVSRSLNYDASRAAAIVTATTTGAALTTGIVAALLKSSGM